MFEYRITKYNPIFRVNGIYTRDEWTELSDVGMVFNGQKLTVGECVAVLSNYVHCLMEIAAAAQVSEFVVSDVEIYEKKYRKIFHLRNGESVSQQRLRLILMGCLQSMIWCRLSGRNAFIHFGYDLYVFVGCELDCASVERICSKYGLFCEAHPSPCKDLPD